MARKQKQAEPDARTDFLDMGEMHAVPVVPCEAFSAELESSAPTLGVYSLSGVHPEKATAGSAAVDLTAYLPAESLVPIRSAVEGSYEGVVDKLNRIAIPAGSRALIPTGLFFDIPEGYVMKVFARSGFSFKTGMSLTNSVGIIDSDYKEELFISMINLSGNTVLIGDGERIAQAILEPCEFKTIVLTSKPTRTTERSGGFGSTGV